MSVLMFFALSLLSTSTAALRDASFPDIDLGYAIHAPTFVNATSSGLQVASYNNIRFAQPPTGHLRFRAPLTPPPSAKAVIHGDEYKSTECVNSVPRAAPFPGFNGTTWGQEDCLFLNVQVPEGVKEGDNLPVLHWLYGGAYAFGSKDNPALSWGYSMGLFNALKSHDEKFIFVASNYRLGLYGWMASPYEAMDGNVGARDGEEALRWTKRYISKFGGDPDRITAMGQSAGAGILNYLLVESGTNGTLPFSQAIISSPALMPRRNVTARRQKVYEDVLAATNCTTLQCLQSASPAILQTANHHLLSEVPAGTGGGAFGPSIGFAPSPDSVYVRDEPMVLLRDRATVPRKPLTQLLVGNMAHDGMNLVADKNMPASFGELVRTAFPAADNRTVERIQELFPFPVSEPWKLAWDWATSVIFACHSQSIAAAYAETARRYVMAIPPATHAEDLSYMFFVDNETTPVSNVLVAQKMQEYLLQFIAGRNRNMSASFPVYGSDSEVTWITEAGFKVQRDRWESRGICEALLGVIENPENGC
ncbi:carboxyl ester lipase [Aspergillus floccosus]